MKPDTISYEDFSKAVEVMRDRGEKISVRTVQAQTGGSFTKISAYLKQWREHKEKAESVLSKEISKHLQEAILSEIGKAVHDTKSVLEKKLLEANEELLEAKELITKQDSQLEASKEEAEKLKSSLSTQTALKESMQTRIEVLELKLEKAQAAQHDADKKAAVAEARRLEVEKQIVKQERVSSGKIEAKKKRP